MDIDEFIRRLSKGSGFLLQKTSGNEAAGSYRCVPPVKFASGEAVGYFDNQSPCLTMRKFEAKHEFYDDELGMGRLVFLLHLSGARRIELGSAHQHELTRPTLAVYYHPQGLPKRSVWNRGSHELSLTVGVWPEALRSLFGFYPVCFPNFSVSSGSKAAAFWYSRPLPYGLISATEKLFDPGVHASLLRNYISTKSHELLCLSVNTLLSDGGFLSHPDMILSRVEQVKVLVDANLKQPPLLSELANKLGVSTKGLSHELRNETGGNYAQYITDRRMRRAMLLLEGGDPPLKRVAYEIGYAHTPSFCTAFRRHFGTTPKDLRRR